eukprot:CAMPEP_0195523822 /NCGR_PEP_ID=MMETSP0794_2-20130614/23266_1 /TAXON_ID=515487 /ORGANISM="Stephanopyxis turris, Strain CCMP 815" /LENGTH=165 /DNA_ID=CAMNT_0040653903 /DNA_START=66 /DNA_END=563 /DNA_ORIENTATION=+
MKILSLLLLLVAQSSVSGFIPACTSQRSRRLVKGYSNDSTVRLCAAKKAAPKKKAATKKKSAAKKTVAKEEAFRKADFVAAIAEKTGMSKADSETALAAVIGAITEQVASGKKVSLQGFGTFKLSHRAARKGRNPRTGEEIDIKASNSPSFSASKTFKETCNPDR